MPQFDFNALFGHKQKVYVYILCNTAIAINNIAITMDLRCIVKPYFRTPSLSTVTMHKKQVLQQLATHAIIGSLAT